MSSNQKMCHLILYCQPPETVMLYWERWLAYTSIMNNCVKLARPVKMTDLQQNMLKA